MQCAELFIFGSYFSKCNRTKVSQVTKWMKIIQITVCVLSLAKLTRSNFSITSERAPERTKHTHCPLEHRMQPLSAVCYKRISRMAWNQLHHCMKQCFFFNFITILSQPVSARRSAVLILPSSEFACAFPALVQEQQASQDFDCSASMGIYWS